MCNKPVWLKLSCPNFSQHSNATNKKDIFRRRRVKSIQRMSYDHKPVLVISSLAKVYNILEKSKEIGNYF